MNVDETIAVHLLHLRRPLSYLEKRLSMPRTELTVESMAEPVLALRLILSDQLLAHR